MGAKTPVFLKKRYIYIYMRMQLEYNADLEAEDSLQQAVRNSTRTTSFLLTLTDVVARVAESIPMLMV
jgi:hypothetical protein